MVWYMWVNSMVWYGMVHVGEWYGMVWYGNGPAAKSDKWKVPLNSFKDFSVHAYFLSKEMTS